MIVRPPAGLRVQWLGHAAFAVASPATAIVIDPHRPGALGGRFRLPAIAGPFDAIACSHGHEDHAAWTPDLGTNRWLERDAAIGDLQLRFHACAHDNEGGRRMGLSRMIEVRAGALRLVHSGDLGAFGPDEVAFAAGCDALLLACGGTYTLDATGAASFARAVAPGIVVPMHCSDAAVDLPLAPADAFVAALAAPWQAADFLDLPHPLPDRVAAGCRVVLLRRPAGEEPR